MVKVKQSTILKNAYKQHALLSDIEKSEQEEKAGKVYTHAEVEKKAKK